jgi:peptidyl-dipeptidase Dcp
MQRRTFLTATATTAALVAFRKHLAFAKDKPLTEPLLAAWSGRFGGVPPFDKIRVKNFKAAIQKGMELRRTEIAAIVANKDAATFENTILALEDSGRPYTRAFNIFDTYTASMSDKAMQAVEKEVAPLKVAMTDELVQNEALFARIKTVHAARAKLEPDQQRLTDVTYRYYARRGAALGKSQKERMKAINQRLATLFTTFSQNSLADEESQHVLLASEGELEGLPAELRAAMKAGAAAKKLKGWLISNTRSSVEPFLTYSTRRDLRERAWKMFVSRGESKDHDNRPVISEILTLRAERAKLLGFKTHAHWIVDDNMAKTPDAAMNLMLKVWRAGVARVREEVADMQKIADAEKANHKIAAWDYRFYAEKVRKAKYDLDADEVKQYLQLEKLREGMFWVANQLYGVTFKQVKGLPVYHKDMTTYEVTRDGKHVGLWYFDPYARAGKRSGAWMSEYRTQETFKKAVTPIVSNNSNFVKGKAGAPVLISWDDANTLFHEFGHALHGLVSNVRYPQLAGTNTLRDFVEFPSQLHERWLITPEVLNKFCLHHKTKKPIPPELVAKIRKAKTFNEGFRTVELVASAIYDMKIHLAPTDKPIDPIAFETKLMQEIGAPSEIVLRHRPPHFGHVFSSDDYSAGYYVYLWADTLTADAAEAFEKAPGGLYDKPTAKKLHDSIMSVGNSIPPEVAFRQFRGRDVDINALMRDRGFPVTK